MRADTNQVSAASTESAKAARNVRRKGVQQGSVASTEIAKTAKHAQTMENADQVSAATKMASMVHIAKTALALLLATRVLTANTASVPPDATPTSAARTVFAVIVQPNGRSAFSLALTAPRSSGVDQM